MSVLSTPEDKETAEVRKKRQQAQRDSLMAKRKGERVKSPEL